MQRSTIIAASERSEPAAVRSESAVSYNSPLASARIVFSPARSVATPFIAKIARINAIASSARRRSVALRGVRSLPVSSGARTSPLVCCCSRSTCHAAWSASKVRAANNRYRKQTQHEIESASGKRCIHLRAVCPEGERSSPSQLHFKAIKRDGYLNIAPDSCKWLVMQRPSLGPTGAARRVNSRRALAACLGSAACGRALLVALPEVKENLAGEQKRDGKDSCGDRLSLFNRNTSAATAAPPATTPR